MSTHLTIPGLKCLQLGRFTWLVRPRDLLMMMLLLAAVLLLAMAGIASGSLAITLREAMAIPGQQQASGSAAWVVWELRLPRVLLALLAGGLLGMAGAAMQSVTRNGLADPGLLGVKEGACVVVLALILNFPAMNIVWRPLAGISGGLAVTLLVVLIARDVSRPRVVLIGIGFSWLLAAGLGVFITTADIRDVQTALLWMAGSLQGATWPLLSVALCWMAPGIVLLVCTARAANVALLGHQTATGLGVNLRRQTLMQFVAPVLLTSTVVSCTGSLGFVGLIAPHMARMLVRGGQASLLWCSALLGGLLVLGADSIGRLAFAPLQIPAGIVIAVTGGPFFLFLLWQRREQL